MSVLTNELTLGDLLKYEEESLYSRDQVTVAAGQNLRIGTVLGRVDANGKVKALDPAATDGTQIATAVLLQSVDATTGDKSSGIAATRQAIRGQTAKRRGPIGVGWDALCPSWGAAH